MSAKLIDASPEFSRIGGQSRRLIRHGISGESLFLEIEGYIEKQVMLHTP